MARVMHTLGTMLRETGQVLDRIGCNLQGLNPAPRGHQQAPHRAGHLRQGPLSPAPGGSSPSASVMGDVTIGEKSSIWYGAVLRGDVNGIVVGSHTNIQDNAVVHVAKTNVGGRESPTIIGDRVTVGHNAILHACTISDDAFVGMGATVMDGATLEKGSMVAAGALAHAGDRDPLGAALGGRARAVHAGHDRGGEGVHDHERGDVRGGGRGPRGRVREVARGDHARRRREGHGEGARRGLRLALGTQQGHRSRCRRERRARRRREKTDFSAREGEGGVCGRGTISRGRSADGASSVGSDRRGFASRP